MIPIANDNGKKMIEREEAEQFASEYARVTGVDLWLVGIGERPDFVCEKAGRRYGLELVRAMQDPVQRGCDVAMGGDGHLHGMDAAWLVQQAVHRKEQKRISPGWRYPKSAILAIQLVSSDAEEMVSYLDDQVLGEMAETGFREIWVADYSPMEEYGEIQLVGIKPKRWRGLHRHRLWGTKPHG